MRRLWLRNIADFEVLKPEVDDSGYDVVFEANGVVRHVQLKASFRDATTREVKASLKLTSKPSACVVWVRFDPKTIKLGPFYWFGGAPGEPIPPLKAFKVAKHTRGNAEGIKKQRPNQRSIPMSAFARIDDLDELVSRMFGDF